jgi:hypothetical protein
MAKRRTIKVARRTSPQRFVPLAKYLTPVLAESKEALPVTEEQVRLHAYLKWEAAGKPPGDGVNFWLEAKRELGQQ